MNCEPVAFYQDTYFFGKFYGAAVGLEMKKKEINISIIAVRVI